MNTSPFVIERTYNAPVDTVWKAITDKDQMKQWYFNLSAFKPEVGFEFEFTAGDGKKEFRHLCKITDVEPNKKLAYSWSYDGYPGNSIVSFELLAEGQQTRLVLTHEGLESFPDLPEFARTNFAAGWLHIIGTALKEFVEKA
jgi:uncharacterized protein YndB with AHSA1/START domain